VETKKTGAQDGRGNYDDLVIASALAFYAIPDAIDFDPTGMVPVRSKNDSSIPILGTAVEKPEKTEADRQKIQRELMASNDPGVMIPLSYNTIFPRELTQEEQIAAFSNQLISGPRAVRVMSNKRPVLKLK
jgi:hypothetical protein